MTSLRTRMTFVLALAALAHGVPAQAQNAQGRLTGVVRDATGAALPGATVAITNVATGATATVTSAPDGGYGVAVVPGVYTVTASLRGFGRQIKKEVRVEAAGTVTADFALEPQLQEEVTVTAMKREQAVEDVPFSIAAPTQQVLQARGVEDLEGVAANVGGLTVQNLGPGQSQIAMRGVSAGQIVRDQPGVKEQVGVYMDESVISLSLFTPDMDLFDVSRVEVLRGPQGTLFGSGSLSGTVRYITNQPEIGARRFFGEVGGNTIHEGSQGGNVKLGFNAPMGGRAAARVVGYYDHMGGFIDAVQPNLSVKEDVNSGYRAGTRAAITWAASDKFSLTPRIIYQKVKMDGWNRVDIYNILGNPFTTTRPAVTLGPLQEFSQLDEVYTDRFVLGDVMATYHSGTTAVTSITSYNDRDVLVIRDATSLTASITGGSIGLPANVYTLSSPLNDKTKAKVFTEELRVSGGKDKFHWVTGGFYSHTRRDYGQSLPTTGFTALSGIPTQGLVAPTDDLFHSELGYKLNQFALFGEGTYSVGTQVDITAGLRYYHFDEDKTQIFDGIFGNDNNGTSLVSQPGSTNADGVAPRFILTYKVTDKTNLNAQVSKGFRLGGINDPLNVPICTPADLATFSGHDQWTDEKLWNYEVGAKSRLFGNKGSLNLAAFYMDIKDLQATVTAGSCSSRLIYNVPKARSTGFEWDFVVAPNRTYDFAITGTVNDSKLKSSVPPVGATGIVEDRRLPTVPKFQMAAAATLQKPMGGPQRMGYVTGVYQHVGSRWTQIADQDLGTLNLLSFAPNTIGGPLTQATFTYDPELPAYDLVNLRVGLRLPKWDISLYGNNLTNERALLSFDRERGTRARDFYLVNQPRTFGITARFNY